MLRTDKCSHTVHGTQVEELRRQLAAAKLETERAKAAEEKARRDAEERANTEREVLRPPSTPGTLQPRFWFHTG